MKNNTEIDYRNAIKAKYEEEKSGDFHGFLENPSPAQLREFCLLKFDNGLNKIDESIFRVYFKVSNDENLRDAIYNYHSAKFKSIQSFLIEEKKKTNIRNLNLAAALIDYNPRPFNKFSKDGSAEQTNDVKTEHNNADEDNKEIVANKKPDTPFTGIPVGVPLNKPKNSLRKKATIGMGVLIITFSVGYTTKQFVLPKKECMQWQNDHYEMVDCQNHINSLYTAAPIIPYDEDIKELNKLTVCDTTTFFVGDKAKIWYCKVDGKPEFFDDSGFHPITGNPLKAVTHYIVEKYVGSCK